MYPLLCFYGNILKIFCVLNLRKERLKTCVNKRDYDLQLLTRFML